MFPNLFILIEHKKLASDPSSRKKKKMHSIPVAYEYESKPVNHNQAGKRVLLFTKYFNKLPT